MIGGTFSDLTHMDRSSKTIILMGEEHTSLDVFVDTSKYDVIEAKQKAIIDFVLEKFTGKHITFYSEAPNDARDMIMKDESLRSSRVIKYASNKMPIQLSHVTACHRDAHGSCDERYASEILQIIKDGFDCVIVQIGLFHVPYIRDLIRASAAESHIDVRIEPSYDLPRYSATIVKNESGVDVYKCPVCNALSSPAAVFVPTNASYFIHNPGCENATKVPTSESRIGAASFGGPSWAAEERINPREQALKRMEERSRKFEEASRKFSNGSVEEVEEVD